MNASDLLALLPLIILAGTSVVVIIAIAFYRNYRLTVFLTLAGMVGSFLSLPFALSVQPRQVTPLLIVDGTTVFYIGLVLTTSFVVVLLSYQYFRDYDGNREEYYLLLILATLGSGVLVASNHFAAFFLGIEVLSVSLYALIAYPRYDRRRVEASIKYLILAGATSAFLLFGMALIYSVGGTLEFSSLAKAASLSPGMNNVLLIGWGMLIVGIGFKLALVPFHMWTPDVYQGAPAPITGFVATVSKGGVFALILRYFSQVPIYDVPSLWWVFAAIAIASMLLGNMLALMQTNVKRVLAYSSISHLGYLLIAFLSRGTEAQNAAAFYLVAYFATTLAGFGVITMLSDHENELEDLDSYRGLFWKRPGLALVFSAALLSLAGLPPSAGLVGKIFVAAAGVNSALWLLLIVLVIASVIGVFYYFRIMISLYRSPEADEERTISAPSLSMIGSVTLAVLVLLVVGLGIYPAPVMGIISRLITGLS